MLDTADAVLRKYLGYSIFVTLKDLSQAALRKT